MEKDGSRKDIAPNYKMEEVQPLPESSGPRLQCEYSVGKKPSIEKKGVGSLAGRGK